MKRFNQEPSREEIVSSPRHLRSANKMTCYLTWALWISELSLSKRQNFETICEQIRISEENGGRIQASETRWRQAPEVWGPLGGWGRICQCPRLLVVEESPGSPKVSLETLQSRLLDVV